MWLKLINCLHGLERARLTFMVRSLFVSIWEDPRFTFPFKKKGQIPALEPVQPKYRKVSKRHEGKLVPQEDLQALNLMWHSGQLALSHKQLGKQNSKHKLFTRPADVTRATEVELHDEKTSGTKSQMLSVMEHSAASRWKEVSLPLMRYLDFSQTGDQMREIETVKFLVSGDEWKHNYDACVTLLPLDPPESFTFTGQLPVLELNKQIVRVKNQQVHWTRENKSDTLENNIIS